MDTIDPEVRTDVEFAARLLGRTLARRQAIDAQVRHGGALPAWREAACKELLSCGYSGAPPPPPCLTSAPCVQADSATSAASGGLTSSCSTAASAASVHQPALAQCARGEVDAAAFVALMEDVVSRTKGQSSWVDGWVGAAAGTEDCPHTPAAATRLPLTASPP